MSRNPATSLSDSNFDEATREQPADSEILPSEQPERIGRYRVEGVIGAGGFGLVFRAHDEQLDRDVAIKVPHASRLSKSKEAMAYLSEARALARLDHPNIVPVHDVGRTNEIPCFVVSKLILGTGLAQQLKTARFSVRDAAELVATIAEALHYAHQQGLVHRDVKPGNILIEKSGKPILVDFGLALRDENVGKGPRNAGTPAYMSPEQARGEGHRVDGRSDVFSLGVVFYEMLSGRKPFHGETESELLEQVASVAPRPLRQYDEKLPGELVRICNKAMAKRSSERYGSAFEFADDLRHFLATRDPSRSVEPNLPAVESGLDATRFESTESPTSQKRSTSMGSVGATHNSSEPASVSRSPIQIVPKGLRSFDEHDADFFLELLPGPRDRNGLPDSLRFWKLRIEETDPSLTFKVGLIYGPSGCGKSSLVKAGLLPRISSDVIQVYVESTSDETESRLLNGLRKQCPELDVNWSLKDSLASLRCGSGKKILIVIDQFEQWLHAHPGDSNASLIHSLRQCDGGRVQCILLVRDDFWLSVSRFLRALEVRIVDGRNVALADLFDLGHARNVLEAFGRAMGRLPVDGSAVSAEQDEFLRRSIAGLAEDGKIICVRLALFAEMMKGREWTSHSLQSMGGTEGVGVSFLESAFSSPAASPVHRFHQAAIRAVLRDLLPEPGTNIKGHMRSYADLLNSSGYQNRPDDFDEVIRILDREVRLITPTAPDGVSQVEVPNSIESGNRYYQLAHDYLVPALREWLTSKQKETIRGRAELRLKDRSASWNARPENRLLPSWWRYVNLLWFTDRKIWTESERRMMRKAGSVHGVRILLFAMLAWILTLSIWQVNQATRDRQRAAVATRLVDGLLLADTSQVRSIIDEMEDYRSWVSPGLKLSFAQAPQESNAKLHAALALLQDDASVLPFLEQRLLNVSPTQFEPVCQMLEPYQSSLVQSYWEIAGDESADHDERFQAACALATFEPEHPRWTRPEFREFVAEHLVNGLPSHLLPWRTALRPVKSNLAIPLSAIYRDTERREQVRSFATDTLTDYLADDADAMFGLIVDSNELQFGTLLSGLKTHPEQAVELALQEISKSIPDDADEPTKEALAKRQANAGVVLILLGQADAVWPLFRHGPDPRLRSYLIHWLSPRGADPAEIWNRFQVESDVTIQRALLLSLGEFERNQVSENCDPLIDSVVSIYRDTPDAGLHAAAEWLLRVWGEEARIEAVNEDQKIMELTRDQSSQLEKQWYVNGTGQSFVVLEAGELEMGSPPSEPHHYANEKIRLRRINRRIAFAAKHVTKGEWRRFCASIDHKYHADKESLQEYIRTDDSPMVAITWFEAAEYCNWLSEQEGIPESQWCYVPNEDGEFAPGMKAKDKFWNLNGYRLATEPEWEYACRAGSTTSRFYGISVDLLHNYAWFATNNANHTRPVGTKKPNDFGLFDMQGNAFDWCYNRVEGADEEVVPGDDHPPTDPVLATDNRILRGGSFVVPEANVRSAARYFNQPATRRLSTSFRVVRTMPPLGLSN